MSSVEPPTSPAPPTFYLAGPTAVGKTEIAAAVAEKLGAEIVGCDAFQVYEGLPILTAKPSAEILARVPHHLIGEIPLSQSFDVAQYCDLARTRIAETHSRGRPALVVGGTGLYLRALTRGLADLPSGDAHLRAELNAQSLADLQQRLKRLDPVAFERIDLKNPRRVVRALEVCILTGKPFSSFQTEWNDRTDRQLSGVLLDRSRTELCARINRRVEWMFASGVIAEVATASPIGATAAQTLGLGEIQALLRNELTEQEAIHRVQQATRQYAKRQQTWFRRETWLKPIVLDNLPSLEEQVVTVLALLDSGK